MIDAEKFQNLADTYGADIKRWPEPYRVLAAEFFSTHQPDAQRILQEARELDMLLDLATKPDNNNVVLRERIFSKINQDGTLGANSDYPMEIPANDTISGPGPNRRPPWKAIAATLVLTTGLGFGAGQLAAAKPGYSDAEVLLSLSMTSQYSESDFTGFEGDAP